MGLTYSSVQKNSLQDIFTIGEKENKTVIALAGNPNTGKSTVFNALTGLNQHTGNWPGKTVVNARGDFSYNDKDYVLVDLPGTYSLFASSVEEMVARDFLCFGNIDAAIVVTDATCLERNLSLVFQVMELTPKVILCINLIDEAKKKNISVDGKAIEDFLGIPVVLTAARSNEGLDKLKEAIEEVSLKADFSSVRRVLYPEIEDKIKPLEESIKEIIPSVDSRWLALRLLDSDEVLLNSIKDFLGEDIFNKLLSFKTSLPITREHLREYLMEENYKIAEEIKNKFVTEKSKKHLRDEKIDNILTSKTFGIPIMLLLLAIVFWITLTGANVPSSMLSDLFTKIEVKLSEFIISLGAPMWFHNLFVLGIYKTLAWVVAVMLPPMAIFFPIFTLLEDLGYLPRVAFNMDHLFKKACAHGKQCLTMCMGFGCNAAGVIGCRIIESPRERLIAIITNNFVPCNGRFPTIIAISSVFFMVSNKTVSSFIPALTITILVIIGIGVTLLVSYLLSKTLLKGVPSTFTLELPPYRKPQIGRVLYNSIVDRTIFVLSRAVMIAIPAGALTWIFANIYIGDMSILAHVAGFLEPFAKLIGLDGFILLAFILGFPANEIVLPIILMSYLSTGVMVDFDSIESLRTILLNNGWTYLTALNTMLFSLLHWPCSTTLWTIKKETGSLKWTALAFLIPTVIAIVVCFITTTLYKVFGF